MSFESMYAATAGIGDAYARGLQSYQKRTALAKLGEQIQGGDLNGAAQTAFVTGDVATGAALLKLGTERDREREQRANVGLIFGSGNMGGGETGSLSALGTPSRSLPSFADTSGPAGGYLAGLEKRESGGNAMASNPASSAVGLHQFTKPTWAGVMREHPELGLTAEGRTDPVQSRRAVAAFTADNETALQRAGLPVNDASRYASHFLGRSGGPRFVAGALNNPDAPASSYANPDQVRANRRVFFNRNGSPKTAAQVMADFGRSFAGSGRPAGAPARAPVQFADNEAETQALEARMGMVPQAPRQVTSLDPRADMPAEGAVPMVYSIPEGRSMVGGEDRSAGGDVPSSPSPIFNGQARQIANSRMGAPAMGAPPPGRAMSLPPEAGGPPVQITQAGSVPVGAVGQPPAAGGGSDLMSRLARMAPNERVSFLLRAQSMNLPDEAKAPLKALLDNALQEARMPDSVKEYLWARSNGMTQATSPGAYAREQKGPQVVAPGSSVLTEDGRGIALTVPERNRSNVADDVEARRQAAAGLGLREGTPQFQSYVLTGKMPREDQHPLSASDKKAILEADDAVMSAETAIGNLKAAKDLSAKAYAGPLANWRGWATGALGSETGQATQELDNLVTTNALGQLKAIFGAAPTEGERKILLDIQGSSNLPHALRVKIYDRGIALAERRLQMNRERASDMRGQTYFRPDGGPQGARGASSAGGAPSALPAPSSANRPGAASAGDRFGALVGSGLSREQAFEQMQREGY